MQAKPTLDQDFDAGFEAEDDFAPPSTQDLTFDVPAMPAEAAAAACMVPAISTGPRSSVIAPASMVARSRMLSTIAINALVEDVM